MFRLASYARLTSRFRMPENPLGDVDALRLTQDNIASISQIPNISSFKYDRSTLKPSILHLGLRDFHRVHQLAIWDDVLNANPSLKTGVISVGLNETHRKTHEELQVQDGLFTLVSRSPSEDTKVRIIGSCIDTIYGPKETKEIVELIANPSIVLISLTLKEKNYYFEEDFANLNLRDSHISNDLYSSNPRTPVGIIVKGLSERMKNTGDSPITILSCDNLYRNGDITKKMVKQFVENRKPANPNLSEYIEKHVSFPNSMCDRICNTDPRLDFESLQQMGVRDNAILTTEDFSEWIVENNFQKNSSDIMKALSQLPNCQIVENSAPFENIKTRFNYGLRLSLATLALGCESTHPSKFLSFEAIMKDPIFQNFARTYCAEIESFVGDVPSELNLTAFAEQLMSRISTPKLRYTVKKVTEDISKKSKMEWEPVITNLSANGTSSRLLALSFANWIYVIEQCATSKIEMTLMDSNFALLAPAAIRAVEGDPQFFFNCCFGGKADEISAEFKTDVISALKSLQMRGTYETLRNWVH